MYVEANRTNVDQVSIQLFETGSSETSVTLRHALLDETLKYHFGVTSLNVPLDGCPIMQDVTQAQELFRIERRNVGADLTTNNSVTLQAPFGAGAADRFPPYTIDPGRRFYDAVSFVRHVANYCRIFEAFQSAHGLADLTLYGAANANGAAPNTAIPALVAPNTYEFIKCRVSSDGRVVFSFSTHFTNNFYMRFTQRGVEYFGLTNEVLESVPGHYYLVFTTVGGVQLKSQVWTDNLNVIQLGNNTTASEVLGDAPIFELLDHRVSISVESHLPVASSIMVVDGKEKLDRKVCERFFESPLKTAVVFDSDGQFQSTEVARRVYNGMVSFVKKSDPNITWYRLLTSAGLYFFRFHLYNTYRRYDEASNTWALETKRLNVSKTQYWEMELSFISDT